MTSRFLLKELYFSLKHFLWANSKKKKRFSLKSIVICQEPQTFHTHEMFVQLLTFDAYKI